VDGGRGKGSVIGFTRFLLRSKRLTIAIGQRSRDCFWGDLPAEPSFVCLSPGPSESKAVKAKRLFLSWGTPAMGIESR
jgi:hypothetical protein